MKALVKKEAKPGLWLEDVAIPKVGINDVLIRVDRAGICGTDLHIYNWDARASAHRLVPTLRARFRARPTLLAFYVGAADERFREENVELA
ncbi:MAG TPA: alcohol dehydrogenase catalytic domain-containing protein, partial [Verrucomicrobiae bacterium]|nr:alcohol dehydrogenase catalytic domain-containing protein [Verrucomicrobiae bacterium]